MLSFIACSLTAAKYLDYMLIIYRSFTLFPVAATLLLVKVSISSERVSAGSSGCMDFKRLGRLYYIQQWKTEIAFECARRAANIISSSIPKEKIGVYFREREEIKEITISTYQSIIYNPDLIRKSKMLIFDEVHLVSDTTKVLRTLGSYCYR